MMWHNTLICLSIKIRLLCFLSSIKKDHKLPRKSENSKPYPDKNCFYIDAISRDMFGIEIFVFDHLDVIVHWNEHEKLLIKHI